LTSSPSVGCFFLDACVVLSEILGQNPSRMEKMKKDVHFHSISCYVSNSVETETRNKVQKTSDFLGSIVRDTIQYHLEENRRKRNIPLSNPMDSNDVNALEDLFSWYNEEIRKNNVLTSPVSLVEEWAISFLADKLDRRVSITIDTFVSELVKKLLQLTSDIENSYDNLITFEKSFARKIKIVPHSSTISAVEALGLHEPDCDHVAAALENQQTTKQKMVFVTLDFATVLDKRDELRKNLGIVCSDPLYAAHHLV
jgi:hypothetical protein